MKRWILLPIAAAVAVSGWMAEGGRPGQGKMQGLVAHYFKDPEHWGGAWPDTESEPNAGTDPKQWTFREYRYSRVEPVINHLFIKEGWFSVRWTGVFDPSAATPCGATVEGCVNINPNNRKDFELCVVTPQSGTITRDDLTKSYTGYSGPAVSVHVRPQGNGNQNTLCVNGIPYPIDNAQSYDILSTNMSVRLYKDRIGRMREARGAWWMALSAKEAVIVSSADGISVKDIRLLTHVAEIREPHRLDCYFEIHADDGCRLILDGETLIDDWRPCWEQSPESVRRSRTVTLDNKPHRILVEYFQGQSLPENDADPMRLYWSCPARGIFRQIIPSACLFHMSEDAQSPYAR